MFILDEQLLNVSLDKINQIVLTFYQCKNDFFNIYDTNYTFNEDMIPLMTSILEKEPHIFQAKKYHNLTCESLIINTTNKSQCPYPSIYNDIKQNSLQYVQVMNRNLVSTLDMKDDKVLIRMYNISKTPAEFGKNMLNEEEQTIIMWNWDKFNLQLVINKSDPTICQMQMNIFVQEDNKFIISKIENINNVLQKLQTIQFAYDYKMIDD
jgi:hypothetical protein